MNKNKKKDLKKNNKVLLFVFVFEHLFNSHRSLITPSADREWC